MAKKGYRTVKGRLGVIGWISRIALVVWTVAMIGWLWGAGDMASEATSTAEQVGVGIGIWMIIIVWMVGTVIFGIWALLTRPARTMVPIDDS